MTELVAASYVVHDGNRPGGGVAVIWGHGPTAEEAETNFRQVVTAARVTILGPGEQLTDRTENWTHAATYRTIPATAALLVVVEAMGAPSRGVWWTVSHARSMRRRARSNQPHGPLTASTRLDAMGCRRPPHRPRSARWTKTAAHFRRELMDRSSCIPPTKPSAYVFLSSKGRC